MLKLAVPPPQLRAGAASAVASLQLAATRCYAFSNKPPSPLQAEIARLEKETPRSARIKDQKRSTIGRITELDQNYDIFTTGVKRVLDLGNSPGYWSQYAKDRIIQNHNFSEAGFRDGAFVLGVDILNTIPPLGISVIQGNVLSDTVRVRAVEQCRELAYRQLRERAKHDDTTSYFVKEQKEDAAHQEINHPAAAPAASAAGAALDYKVDLVLSDLTMALSQEKGFWHNTSTRPFLRLARNNKLRSAAGNQMKAPFDLADASLVYAIDLLREGGSFVLRLNGIRTNDPELDLLESRLKKVFRSVESAEAGESFLGEEVFYICKDKDDSVDKVSAFTLRDDLRPKL